MIVVTGASRGIGKAICERLVSKDIDVLGIARNVKEISFNSLKCDVSSYDDIKKVVTEIKKSKKKVNALINAAGIASMNLAVTTPKDVVNKIINTNLIGSIYFSQLITPLMMRNKQGSIINFSTVAVSIALKGESIYIASKAGIEGFSRSFAREVSDFNINVNCISPGPIKTNLIKGVSEEQIKKVISHQLIPKQFLTTDICDVVELLLDSKSSSITGQVFHIGGI
jgi:3-oxoacyl-[acyl-carrier protein] reductase|tara:strand:- start:371 stop:1048 length:678 start_codon:yes stop_codon:yes gene_type:complete